MESVALRSGAQMPMEGSRGFQAPGESCEQEVRGAVSADGPSWQSSAPLAAHTVPRSCDWTGKPPIFFKTGSSVGFGRSLSGIEAGVVGMDILEGISFMESTLGGAQSDVPAWPDGLARPERAERR